MKKNKRGSMYIKMSIVAIIMGIISISTIFYGVAINNWGMFALGLIVIIALSLILLKIYYAGTMYICPNCNEKFKAEFKEFYFADHTLRTRKLTCPHCKIKEFCIETNSD